MVRALQKGRVFLNTVKKWKYLLFTLIVCVLYAAVLADHTMPFAEGWYTYYAKCINNGELAYRDFDYLFPPLYIYLIAIITKIFGYKLIVLRIFGVIVFAIIAFFLFLIIRTLFGDKIAMVATITSSLYMQSEVVQIFYDYIRVMDIFVVISAYLLIRLIKNEFDRDLKTERLSIYLGFSIACVTLIKQNVGLIIWAFIFAYLMVAMYVVAKPRMIRVIIKYLAGYFVPILVTALLLLTSGSLFPFLHQTGGEALAAKGGVFAILFHWIPNNIGAFRGAIEFAVMFLAILVVSMFASKKIKKDESSANWGELCLFIAFPVLSFIGVVLFSKNENVAMVFDGYAYLSPYSVFLIVVPIFIYYVGKTLVFRFSNDQIDYTMLCYVALSGMYVAIAWGCGMSGGLAEGQATLGVAFIIGLLLFSLDRKYLRLVQIFVVFVCLLMSLQLGAKKMIHSYNWWGMDESNFWESSEVSEKIDLLDGIKMSPETLEAYETVWEIVEQNTGKDDFIYCFPQIPSFYYLCDRNDPGVRAKVQWFDVASDASIDNDMKVLEANPPKAIIIYESSEYAYDSHERAFRAGELSATRRMKQFLLDYATQHAYTFYGRVSSTENNSFLVYYKSDNDYNRRFYFEGMGTFDYPYLIKSEQDLVNLSQAVANGNDYSYVYFAQDADLDMGNIQDWIPIGEFESGHYFRGIYDGRGNVIKNITCENKGNVGLFGQLAGCVCNLGIVDCRFSGSCVGIVSSHSFGERAMIINCYTDSDVSGYRAGGIADNFYGRIINSVSYSNCNGMEVGAGISYSSGGVVENVYAAADLLHSEVLGQYGNLGVKNCTEIFLQSPYLLGSLNEYVDKHTENELYENELKYKIHLMPWAIGENGRPVLIREHTIAN